MSSFLFSVESGSRKIQWVAWTLLVGVILYMCVVFVREQARKSNLPVIGQVEPFTLTNQLGDQVTLADLKGKVWVTDIIFTRCMGPCPKMTEKMSELQQKFSGEKDLRLVTLTTDPDHDSPAILKSYAEKFQNDPSRWFFVTGPKPEIKQLAKGSLKLAAEEKSKEEQENPNDLFIHNTVFMLVDKHGRMRGQAYESLEPNFHEKIQQDIRALLRES